MLGLYREPGQALFAENELDFLRCISPYLAEGAQRGLLLGETSDPEGPDTPGLVVLRDDWSVESLSPGVALWLSELPDGDWEGRGKLPSPVLAVAGRALRTADHEDAPGEGAVARVLSQDGRWMVLHGAALVGSGGLPDDQAGTGRYPSGPVRGLHGSDRRPTVHLSTHGPAAPQERARRRAFAAGESWSGKYSSHITSRACATTSGA